MKTSKTCIAAAALALAVFAAPLGHAAGTIVLDENFNNVANLPNWLMSNNSSPQGLSWFQGNDGVFPAQAGMPGSYIAANYLSAAQEPGSIDNWLITPELTLGGATYLSFYTRSDAVPGLNDMLEVRFSSGAGTDTAGFTTLLTTIGGPSAYPDTWQLITASLTSPGDSGRFAFRYVGDAAMANYIGIDSVTVTAVPEPAAWIMLGLGLAVLVPLRRTTRS
ncbi:hypothetical protein CR105_16260 [Massilia eurypsychrophila]|jgi:hypothetical protein|uniref:Cleaved adhesin domain-containing protein n=1 Tax=Massilia eurypsychrophila TaxID=1485217 RepID=A0A2G8TCX0_9BURK|nr:choice-of-anchor J domain-containing protein [Massilia eurypsychrophila]PIL43901.1 hypothetical protein CR105_16260 [Massilia eurypsychrophila]